VDGASTLGAGGSLGVTGAGGSSRTGGGAGTEAVGASATTGARSGRGKRPWTSERNPKAAAAPSAIVTSRMAIPAT